MSTSGQPTNQFRINPFEGFTMYLAVDGTQYQYIKVPNDRQKAFTFQNQANQIVQAIPVGVISDINQTVVSLFETNENCSTLSNPSQINTIQRQQQTPITCLATQQLRRNSSQTAVTDPPRSAFHTRPVCHIDTYQPSLAQAYPISSTPIRNGNTLRSCRRDTSLINNENDSSLSDISNLDDSKTTASGDVSFSEIADEIDHLHAPCISSNLSKNKRRRSNSYEQDPRTNEQVKVRSIVEPTELIIPNLTRPTKALLMRGQTTTVNHLCRNTTAGTPFISSNEPNSQRTAIPINNTSLVKKFCSKSCSTEKLKTTNGEELEQVHTSSLKRPKPFMKSSTSHQLIESNMNKRISSSLPDHDLPTDPSKWTVYNVRQFIERFTDDATAQAFYKNQIDGEALLPMSRKDLRDKMKIHLSPSIIISVKVAILRQRVKSVSS